MIRLTRIVGNELPPDILDYLSGRELRSRAGKAILVATVDENGWPHFAMLSCWEIVAKDARNIRMATYATSRTASNLRRSGKVTIVVIDRGMTYYVKGVAAQLRERLNIEVPTSLFHVRVETVLEDTLPGVTITSGITFTESGPAESHEAVFREIIKS